MSETLRYDPGSQTILSLQQLQQAGHLNLTPGFQRKSVWRGTDRRKLIESILDGYPIPSIFLYKRDENGRPVYDVIDGKQRLETIFMFCGTQGFRRQRFDVRFQFPEDEQAYWYDWRALRRWGLTEPFLSYRIQTVEVSGDLADIVDLFVRINSTGKALTASERRHARFYRNPLLKESERLTRRIRRFLLAQRVLSPMQVDRMRDTELVCELLVSIQNGGPINKKIAVDRAVSSAGIDARTVKRISRELLAAVRAIRRLFPDLAATRFRNSSEFYSLVLAVWELQQRKLVLSERRRNRVANQLLVEFATSVDRVLESRRGGRGPARGDELFDDYLGTVRQSTDNIHQRKRRAEILRGLFDGLFERKDDKRLFSPEQRRILWHGDQQKSCRHCGERLSWVNFQVDHRRAHSRGGRTSLRNADLVCRSCNASKGARRRPGARAPRRRRARSRSVRTTRRRARRA